MATASLAMYDLPETAEATDAWWRGLARALAEAGVSDVPLRLSRDLGARAAWEAPDLLLAQTCGYPLTHRLAGRVRPVATPAYACDDCEGAKHRSLVVIRKRDPASGLGALFGSVAAVNDPESQTGANALRALAAPWARDGRFFRRVLVTGSHAASLAAVQDGRADLCAVDCVTFALLRQHCPAALAGLRVLARSEPFPGLPYVTRADADDALVETLRGALFAALEDPALTEARDQLLLAGAEVLSLEAYAPILEMEHRAEAFGYPPLA